MSRTWAVPLSALLLWPAFQTEAAETSPAAQAIIDRAIEARGGATLLKRYSAATWKIKGVSSATPGRTAEYEGEVAVQDTEHLRIDVTGDQGGTKVATVLLIDGDRGWSRSDGTVDALGAEELVEQRERLYANAIATLRPLASGGYGLAVLPEKRVGDRRAIGVKVEREGHRDVRLYFDPRTTILLSMETVVRDPMGKEVVQEVRFSNYQTVQGLRQPMKFAVRWERRKQAAGEYSEFKFLETLPESVFAKP